MEEARKIKVGISIGDPNGIGIEVILKIFEQKELFDFFTPVLYGNMKLSSFQKRHLKHKSHVVFFLSFYVDVSLTILPTYL